MVDWSELPKDLLFQIGKHLETHFDVLHFRSVCPTWRASVPLNIQRPSFSSPVLIYTNEYGGKFSLLKRTVCLLEFPAEEEPSQTSTTTPRFLLAMLEEDEFGKKHILDPLLMVKLKPVRHPELLLDISKLLVEELGHEYVLLPADGRNLEKLAYIDANINGDDHFMVVAKDYDNRALSLIKSGDKELTVIQKEGFGCCVDFIQFKHKFYAVDDMIATVCIEPLSEAPFLVAEGSSTYNEYESFLAESCGKLLLVKRFGANPLFSRPRCPLTPTIRFEVFQLDEERKRWVLLESLGDRILFLGGYCNFSAPAIPGVEGNCILFNLATAHGSRVFDLSSGTTVALDHRPDLLQLFRPPSFW